MKTILRMLMLIIVMTFINSCHNSKSSLNEEIKYKELKKEISKEWLKFFDAWVKGDAIRSASFFCEDGIHFRPGTAIDTGRVKIEETFSRMLSAYKVEYCRQTTLEIELFTNKIVECGTYEQKWSISNKIMKGSYIAIWGKFDQDSIKLSRLIFN